MLIENSDEQQESRERGPLKPGTINRIVTFMKRVVGSAVDVHGKQLYPYEWNNHFAKVPVVTTKNTKRPAILPEIMTGLARIENIIYRVLFILLGATGARIGEILAVEIDKHISPDFRTISIEQKVYGGVVEARLKTEASWRQVDLHPAISALLRWFVDGRTTGFLFPGAFGDKPISYTCVREHLLRELAALGYENDYDQSSDAGTHIFRRFRITYLRNFTGCPTGLRKFWLGHGDGEDEDDRDEMGGWYDRIGLDRPFRLKKAEEFGFGFELPSDAPNVPKILLRKRRKKGK
ncbi:MAG TPA: site-specific integrase [Edaphobacter sp.]|uniref:site-specific integrase n=1 Tax=Edaphobacter sp. TaxID=1934404 RepID=UPI002C2E8A88|nr:site-specific integrase [Edaphobacter sp.]HUZ94892.1 site-specific integrase [Edaphobacter sp.]